jgi:hypothetical protein
LTRVTFSVERIARASIYCSGCTFYIVHCIGALALQQNFVLSGYIFISIVGVATLTGFAWMLIGNWWTAVHRPFEPMRVVLQTQQTPAQVNRAMIWAIVQGIFVMAGIVVVAIFIAANWQAL